MTHFLPLIRREWLQHRFGWSLLALLPLALGLLVAGFGQVEFDGDSPLPVDGALPVMLAFAVVAGATAIVFTVMSLTSLIIVSGLARRDHADRSIEFWLSLPLSHGESLAVPLLVHLVLVPVAALLVGLLGGYAISIVLVARMAGPAAWLELPWGALLPATLAIVARLAAGLPLALLWLSPLIMLTVLSTALFRRWGIVLLAVAIGLGSTVLERLFGQPMLSQLLGRLLRNAGQALASASGTGLTLRSDDDPLVALQGVPGWALADLSAALGALASPLTLGALVVAAACFALLVNWRQRSSKAAD